MSRRIVRIAPIFALALFAWVGGIDKRDVNARMVTSLPTVPSGFTIERIARIDAPRELAVTPNGDLLVGTSGNAVEIVPDALGPARAAHVFVALRDGESAGISLANGALFIGTYGGVWRVPYVAGDATARAQPQKIASVRPDGGRGHTTTSVAAGDKTLYVGVGSSCNACVERDSTRASILAMGLDGSDVRTRAKHIRNPIALAIDGRTQTLWAGVAGQDELPHGHPYEIFDAVGAHAGTPDYGWPTCYENRLSVDGRDCSQQTVARVALPAYETPIGAAFYDAPAASAYAFPPAYAGGAFVALHGSWHKPLVPPRVAFVPMHGDVPTIPIDWNDPNVQWKTFVGGYQHDDGSRIGRPTGVAVAPDGSLFIADDAADAVYRIRPKR